MLEIPADFLHEPDEQVRGVLGREYAEDLFVRGESSRAVMVLTDRRLYHHGRIYESGLGNKLVARTGTQVVPLEAITRTYYHERPRLGLLALGSVLEAGGIAAAVLGVVSRHGLLLGAGCMAGGLGLIAVLRSFVKRTLFFVVEHQGSAMATKHRWYSKGDVTAFERSLWAEKERVERARAASP
ncbi:MAG: hypothetical protein ACLF0G_17090 [Candidatus Brocadiia bacterium]